MIGPAKLLSKFISANILWYFILAFLHFDLDMTEWWAIKNFFGRLLLTFIELSIIFSSLNIEENDDN